MWWAVKWGWTITERSVTQLRRWLLRLSLQILAPPAAQQVLEEHWRGLLFGATNAKQRASSSAGGPGATPWRFSDLFQHHSAAASSSSCGDPKQLDVA
jgi:hypothetical protein